MGKTFSKGNQSAVKKKILPLFLPNTGFPRVPVKGLKWTKRILGPELVVFNVYSLEF